MRTDDRGTHASATWRLTRRRAVVARSILLSAVVFTLAALTGAALASAAPARSMPAASDSAVTSSVYQYPSPDQAFARSMVYSGTAALALSVTGIVMVGRRRRFW
jgi:ABC-type Fe3+ transport system permease subunit